MGEQPPRQGWVGERLRQLRTARGLSIRALAAQTGFSPSFISQVEAETASPSIASLQKIVGAVGVTVGEFFRAIEAPTRWLIRRGERTVYRSAWSKGTVAALTDDTMERQLAAFELTVDPGGRSTSRPEPNAHDILLLLMAGTLTLILEHETVTLEVGDSAYVVAGRPHAWENRGEVVVTLLLVEANGRGGSIIRRGDAQAVLPPTSAREATTD